jgi:hypothetical protein
MPAHARRPYGRGQGRGGNARWAPGRVALPFQTGGRLLLATHQAECIS